MSARVLVVDDQAGIRRLIRRILERAGHEVIEAEDGASAVEQVDALGGAIDLLITDVMMPRLDGPGLAVLLREKLPDLGVIYTSGYARDQVGNPGQDEPRSDYLAKPFREADLTGMVSALLGVPKPD